MGVDNELYLWLVNSLLILGVVLFLLGLWILITPASFLRMGQAMSKWITTADYFEYLDKPHYQEREIYKHHRVIGALVFIGALYTLVMLALNMSVEAITIALPAVVNAYWSEWLYGSLYYILLTANFLTVIIGAVIFTRPSLLKGVERVLNRWIDPEGRLKKLDERHEIALEVLPGNPRLFGLAVTLGGLYIMLSMGEMLL